MIPFAQNVVAMTGINIIQRRLNFLLMEQATITLAVIVKIAEIIGCNIINLIMLLQRSGVINAFVAQGHDYRSST